MKYWLGIVVGLLLVARPVAAQESWHITDFHSDLTIEASGVVTVHEKIAVDFGSNAQHGIYRDLPVVYSDQRGAKTYTQIELQSVARDGASEPYTVESSGANTRFKIGNANKTISGAHVYDLTYTATGILRSFTNYDELYWNVTGQDWPVSIEHASATVSLPGGHIIQSACYVGATGSTETCQDFQSGRTLASGEGLTIAVGYTKGLVPLLTVAAPKTMTDVVHNSLTWLVAGLVALLGIGATGRQWWRGGRDPHLARTTIVAEYDPPGGLRPGEIGVLQDERADTMDVTATIIDLAVRGYVIITEIPKSWVFGKVDYELKRTDKEPQNLRDYENQLLQHLFKDGVTIKLSELKQHFYKDLAAIKNLIYEEVVRQGLFIANPQKVRLQYYGFAVGVAVVAGLCLAIGTRYLSEVGVGLGAGLVVAAISLLSWAQFMPKRTEKGAELLRQTKGYKLFVSGTEKYRQPFFENQNIFMEVLPYAMVFGVTEKLVKAFQDMGLKPPAPTWYYGVQPWQPLLFVHNVQEFSTSLSQAMASTPGGSGSGGGGSVGGGFGGGGGGSW